MPTLLRSGPYRLFFYSGDRGEPPHVHVERENSVAKVWLDPVRLERNTGFRAEGSSGFSWIVKADCWRDGMTTSRVEMDIPNAESLSVSEDTLSVELSDG